MEYELDGQILVSNMVIQMFSTSPAYKRLEDLPSVLWVKMSFLPDYSPASSFKAEWSLHPCTLHSNCPRAMNPFDGGRIDGCLVFVDLCAHQVQWKDMLLQNEPIAQNVRVSGVRSGRLAEEPPCLPSLLRAIIWSRRISRRVSCNFLYPNFLDANSLQVQTVCCETNYSADRPITLLVRKCASLYFVRYSLYRKMLQT